MPRSFDVLTETSAPVAAVLDAFGDRRYWLTRLVAYGGVSMSLESLIVADDGAVQVATTQDLRQDVLPGGLGRVLPADLRIVRTESWRPAPGGAEVHGRVHINAHGVPGSGTGATLLSPISTGSRLRFQGSLEVRIPLVGGRIEKYIADLIVKEVPEMQRFTTEWIANNA